MGMTMAKNRNTIRRTIIGTLAFPSGIRLLLVPFPPMVAYDLRVPISFWFAKMVPLASNIIRMLMA